MSFNPFEQREKPKNFLDGELDEAESGEYPFEDRLEFTREMLDQVFEEGKFGEGGVKPHDNPVFKHNALTVKQATGKDGIRHFILPDYPLIPGSEPTPHSRQHLQEWYASPHSSMSDLTYYSASDKRVFIRAHQGRIWSAEFARQPYFRLSMSLCSALVAVTPRSIAVAHIGFSYRCQFEAALAAFRKAGAAPENLYLVASTGAVQRRQAQENAAIPRITDMTEYAEHGILPEHTLSYEYGPRVIRDAQTRDPQGILQKSLVRLDITRDYAYAYTFDETEQWRTGKREVSPYRDLGCFRFPKRDS